VDRDVDVRPRIERRRHNEEDVMNPMHMKAVSLQALVTVIERHKLKPDANDEYQLTNDMLAEALAIDERRGTGPSPEKLRELQDVVEGRGGPAWERKSIEDLRSEDDL